MRRHLNDGLAAAEAAELATRLAPREEGAPAEAKNELATALASFDEGATHSVFDSLLARVSIDTLLRDVVVPYLHELGDGWERGEISIAQEHFASTLLRGRLLGLARGWSQGIGPTAVLACAPGEQHDLGLLAFGIALRARGWRIVYLGPDTPVASVTDAVRTFEADVAIVSAVNPRSFRRCANELEDLARLTRLCLGGAGASKTQLEADVLRLTGDPVDEAERLTRHSRRDGA
jgi:MerR family transcriptional regulator, light-induced transcriptional regulator